MTIRTDGTVDETAAPPTPPAAGAIGRRRMMAVGAGGVLGAAALTACGSSSGGSSASPSAGSDGAGATTDSSGSAATTAGSGGITLAKLADVPVGGSLAVQADGKGVIISQPSAGTVVAFSAVCPHQGCAVGVAKPLTCPCHGSQFNPDTGAVLKGPATKPLTPVTVKVDGENVVEA